VQTDEFVYKFTMLSQVFINQFQQISSINPYRPNIRSAAKPRPVFLSY